MKLANKNLLYSIVLATTVGVFIIGYLFILHIKKRLIMMTLRSPL